MEWQNGRQLSRATTERDSTTEDVLDFAYDANGIRTSKDCYAEYLPPRSDL